MTSDRNLQAAPRAVSVVIVTWRRPESVDSCLAHLAGLSVRPKEVIVVDASTDSLTATVVARYPRARRVSFLGGAGRMTTSRNVGLLEVHGDIVAFIDDDVDVREGWVESLLEAFVDPAIGAVAGRTCNGLEAEETQGIDAIGRALSSGDLTANFAANPGRDVDVDHGIGANMAFRSRVLAELGGFRDDFGGVGGVREDTDIFLRVRSLGYRVVFCPKAAVDHRGAPQAKGRRFDYRYNFWLRRNHALLLARNFGLGSPQFRDWTRNELFRSLKVPHRNPIRRAIRAAIHLAGLLAGVFVSLRKAGRRPTDPVKRCGLAEEIREHLAMTTERHGD